MTYEIGDSWPCECGKEHELTGGYLAAHWDTKLIHTCSGCGRFHTIHRGNLRLVEEAE